SLRVGDGKRLLADHRLAGRCRRDRDLGVSPRRSADVNDVDLGPAHQLAPVGDRAVHTVCDGCRIDLLLVAPADHATPRAVAAPPGGHRHLHSSASFVPNTSTLHTSPRGNRRPRETMAVVPSESSAIAWALSGSPGHRSPAMPEATDVMAPNSCCTSHRV